MRSPRATMLAVAGIAIALTGCSAASPAPPGFTSNQIDTVMGRWASQKALAYSGHMLGSQSDLGFIGFLAPDQWARAHLNCERRLDGVPTLTALYDNASTYAQVVCGIQYPAPQLRSHLRTPDQLGYLWDYYRSDLVPCLRGFGITVDGMPTRNEFRRSRIGGLDAWDPYQHVSSRYGTTSGLSTAVLAKCPAVPAGIPRPEKVPDFLP